MHRNKEPAWGTFRIGFRGFFVKRVPTFIIAGGRGDGVALPLFELGATWLARSRPALADRFAALLPSADAQR